MRFHLEIKKLYDIFLKNGYPKNLLDTILSKFLYDKFESGNLGQKENPDFKFCLKIPYVGKPSLKFKNIVAKLVKSHFDIDISCYFVSFKVRNYFSLKCVTPKSLKANVVYKFSCLRDADQFYIGKTKRHLAVRVLEHTDLEKNNKSAIKDHIKICPVCVNSNLSIDNFKILTKCNNDYETRINEALLIEKFKPELNKQLLNSGKSFF